MMGIAIATAIVGILVTREAYRWWMTYRVTRAIKAVDRAELEAKLAAQKAEQEA
jgi:hypothetical protein